MPAQRVIAGGRRLAKRHLDLADHALGAKGSAGNHHSFHIRAPAKLDRRRLDRGLADPADAAIVLLLERRHCRNLDIARLDVGADLLVDVVPIGREQRDASPQWWIPGHGYVRDQTKADLENGLDFYYRNVAAIYHSVSARAARGESLEEVLAGIDDDLGEFADLPFYNYLRNSAVTGTYRAVTTRQVGSRCSRRIPKATSMTALPGFDSRILAQRFSMRS